MTSIQPFAFPPFVERMQGPVGYANYQEYKDWLRDEFEFRCAYCLEREMWYPSRAGAFSVEHILPQVDRPDLICHYDNLVYACLRCNSFKQNYQTLAPFRDRIHEHLRIRPTGLFEALTPEGEVFIRLFHLNVEPASEVRQMKLLILELRMADPDNTRTEILFRREFGYPDDLPDLRPPAKRPSTNTRPNGASESHFMRKQHGTLPAVY